MRAFKKGPDRFDLIIVGAGPSGLSLAGAISNRGLRVAVIERQSLSELRDPAFDGREIALTHASVDLLRQTGAWQYIEASEISRIETVRVFNETSRDCLRIDPPTGGVGRYLGYLVSNHHIRRAAYRAASCSSGVTLITEEEVADVRSEGDTVKVILSKGDCLGASLVVAADSRFSGVRRKLGIAAEMRDFGRTMLVCRMEHERPHLRTACEWFDYGQTLALLPLSDGRSSVVVTVPDHEARRIQALGPDDLSVEMQARFRRRMGAMRPVSAVFAYPLIAVLPHAFIAPRCALIGDAAVGMHPVTAHGFNLGLLGAGHLARLIDSAAANGLDIGAPDLLGVYARAHRRATVPLYLATNVIASLYTDERLPARVARGVLLRLGNAVTPFKRALAQSLTRSSGC